MIEFNINDSVWVKLTDIGRTELKRQHDDLSEKIGGHPNTFIPKQEDKDGWSKWQMHSLMSSLGSLMQIGFNIPFETTIRIDA